MTVNTETDSIVLQNVINTLCDWFDDLSMKFNSGKCNVIHNARFCFRWFSVDEEKDVGVKISNTLKPSSQCQAAAMKANTII